MSLLFDINQNLQSTYSPTTYEKYSTFSPVYSPTLGYQLDYAYAPSIFIESPGATGAVVTTKKEMTQTPDITGATSTQSPTTTAGQTSGQSDIWGIVLLLGLVGIGGYILVHAMKKKKD